jgi:uncharacterized protein (TIGR02246 family)
VGRLEDAADRVELRALVDRYAVAADTRDRDGFVGAFTGDGVLAVAAGVELRGRQIATPLDYLDAHYERTMHFVGNHDVTVHGDTAHGIVYCIAHHLSRRDGELVDTAMAARYEDTYVRTEAGWRIARRAVTIDWEEDRAALPVRGPLSEL